MTTTVESNMNHQEHRSVGALLLGLIDKPTATFQAVVTQRSWLLWLVPLLITLVAFTALIVVQTPYTLELARTQAESQLSDLSPEQAEQARAGMATTLAMPFMLATTLGFGSIALLLTLVIQAAIFYFGALMLGGQEMRFGDVFTMSLWARLPMALGLLVLTGFTLATGRFIQYPGLAILFASGDPMADAANPLLPLLSGVDLFWMWSLFLLVVGVAVVSGLSRGKALLLVLVYAALALGLTVLPTLLFSGFGG